MYQVCVYQLYTVHYAGVVGFVLVLNYDSPRKCCLWNEVTSTEEVSPLSTAFIVRVYYILYRLRI
jgi:hypothetical protein